MINLLSEAHRLVASGLSVIPVLADGSKRSSIAWKPYQTRLPLIEELTQWLRGRAFGLAVVGGRISGNLEILDFDAPELFDPWHAMADELSSGLLARLPLVQTPTDGRHLYYRCEVIEGNLKLAQRLGAEGRPETLIETRGEGGYAIIPPSPPTCHPLSKPYVLLRGDLAAVPSITPEERTSLLNAARSFNTYVPAERIVSGSISTGTVHARGDRPGDLFNARVAWNDILQPHGWTPVGQRGEETLWKRPGKRESGCSATTNYAGSDLLYVFSTNAAPFEAEQAYSKFAAYALLAHGGDFRAAAKALAAEGYGTPYMQPVARPSSPPPGDDPWGGLRTLSLRPYTGYRGLQHRRGAIHG